MGNALRFLYANCCKPQTQDSGYNYGAPTYTDGVTALVRDIYQYETTSQVPEGLGRYVVSSKKAQANWYKKLVEAWKAARPTPRTPDEAARLVILTLKRHLKADVEGLLAYYGLPYPQAVAEAAELLPPSSTQPSIPPSKTQPAKGVKFELQTLPVDAKAVADGDTVTVYVNTADPREAGTVPKDLKLAMTQRAKARAVRDYVKADALQKKIVDAGYRVMTGPNNEDILAKKYRIRLSGIDAPESSMPFGKEAKDALTKLLEGKCLRVLVYGEDRYGRCVGDIYINNKFVQELMLKKGLVWHYTAYDKRPELASWEKAARAARVGLWASSNPEEPWEWRKKRRNK